MKKRTSKMKVTLLYAFIAMFVLSCTDLDLIVDDSIVSESTGDGFTGVADAQSSLDNLYNAIRGQIEPQDGYYALQEVSSDELLIPTRGTDWGDNGIWRVLHTHTWPASHQYVLNVWNAFNSDIFLANQIIDSRSNAPADVLAQAKFLRAYSMWVILDLYGQVPFREVDEGPEINPRVLSNTEALAFILQDISDAMPDLPTIGPTGTTNLASKAAANFLKARVMLNAGIYRGEGAPNSSDMADVISAVDAIAADGFALQSGYFDLFDGTANNERVWYTTAGTGNRMWGGLHYNMPSTDNSGGGWNGFTTLGAFYDSFEGNPNSNYVGDNQEERRGWVPDASNADATNQGFFYGFGIGQQYNASGSPIQARANKPLVFTKDLPGLVGNSDVTGIRVLKYHPSNGAFYGGVILFRYADALLMKAEALMRTGDDPTSLVNELRTLRGAQPLGSVSESDLLAERGRELYIEMVRRTDLIRFGKFVEEYEFMDPSAVGDVTKNLYPIPANALLSNPNLVQNPGY
ncbi:RagB/SusD family nutrient uptake outer membrane protein [Hyunsoonleella aestuarii]|uniref:RagB/SusD family nutrient uptake outer membrane protein n=1 Tax=Hyunsoonleella aestuarii TaxID=912802 RepID=A0ABP8E9U3_9FLAO|nr:RagB/SusD family nutrient uptake outer membrane protein [Hyunsoonleella aestuarii]